MRKKNYKGRCEKRSVPKCEGVCKTYDALQSRMVDILSEDAAVREIRCQWMIPAILLTLYVSWMMNLLLFMNAVTGIS